MTYHRVKVGSMIGKSDHSKYMVLNRIKKPIPQIGLVLLLMPRDLNSND